ncbi:MAG: NAD+ synthase [Candidatus Thermoplasmatota archaeon]|nr:NAD+ synthase [Candidatus Thermoplasmatota archaeon]
MLEIDPEETTEAVIEFIRSYTENAGVKNVVIGLSGGLDSAVIIKLALLSLGKKNVHAIFMPELSTPVEDFEHVRLISRELDIDYETIDISPLIHSIRKMYPYAIDEITLGNIKSRLRMLLWYGYSNLKKSLVCGCSNKTELLIGYFTKYGDGGSDFMPIGDLYKTQIYQLAEYLEIPQPIIKKAPSAGLWKGQTDEKELGISYEKLDKILYGLERKMPLQKIARIADVDESEVIRIQTMCKLSQHKRNVPLIPKIGLRTISLDWRSPVQEK